MQFSIREKGWNSACYGEEEEEEEPIQLLQRSEYDDVRRAGQDRPSRRVALRCVAMFLSDVLS